MNTNIYKNLYTNVYKPIGSEMPFTGDWQHQVLTDEVGSILSDSLSLDIKSLNQQLPT